jgi:hypothetical protein
MSLTLWLFVMGVNEWPRERTTLTASFKTGNVKYLSNGSVVTLTPSQIATMDPNCGAHGTCPWGPGVDPFVLNYFSLYPTANGAALGDGVNLGSYTFSSPNAEHKHRQAGLPAYRPSSSIYSQQSPEGCAVWSPPISGTARIQFHDRQQQRRGCWLGLDLTPHFLSDLRYGYVRQGYGHRRVGQGNHVVFRFLDQQRHRPVRHSSMCRCITSSRPCRGARGQRVSFAVNYRLIFNNRNSDASSYSFADTNEYWIDTGDNIANTGNSLDPAAFGYAPAQLPTQHTGCTLPPTGVEVHLLVRKGYMLGGIGRPALDPSCTSKSRSPPSSARFLASPPRRLGNLFQSQSIRQVPAQPSTA